VILLKYVPRFWCSAGLIPMELTRVPDEALD
jgi:hypothetical protein